MFGESSMKGLTGKLLRVNLSNKEVTTEKYPKEFALQFVGGREFATKILWNEVPKGTNPLSPGNKFIAAVGPLSGLAMPNVGKVVVAAKSPFDNLGRPINMPADAAPNVVKKFLLEYFRPEHIPVHFFFILLPLIHFKYQLL